MLQIKDMLAGLIPWSRSGAAMLAALFALGACGGPLSTAASIRVEVDVYKGPLSLELDSQWGELLGVVNELKNSLEQFERSLKFIDLPMKDCNAIDYSKFKGSQETEGSQETKGPESVLNVGLHCYLLLSIRVEIDELGDIRKALLKGLASPPSETTSSTANVPNQREAINKAREEMLQCPKQKKGKFSCAGPDIRAVLRNISEVSARLKVKAIYWTQALAAAPPDSYIARIVPTTFASMAAQYSNQMGSRADAILKQLEGKRRELLPSSVYLRDTSPTDYPNVLAWYRAAAPALIAEWITHPFNAASTEETVDRIRVIERLFADHYWTNINTVYGSGQGEVRIALIKDDIGNWNLKSFDSDPTDLLDAYKDVTLAGIKLAADVAAKTATGGTTEALDLASRLARGRMGSEKDGVKAGRFNTEALHARTVARLEDVKSEVAERKDSLDAERTDLKVKIEMKETQIKEDTRVATLESDIKSSQDELLRLNKERDALPEEDSENRKRLDDAIKSQEASLAKNRPELFAAQKDAALNREELKDLKAKLKVVEDQRGALAASVIRDSRAIIRDHEAVIDVLQDSLASKKKQAPQPDASAL